MKATVIPSSRSNIQTTTNQIISTGRKPGYGLRCRSASFDHRSANAIFEATISLLRHGRENLHAITFTSPSESEQSKNALEDWSGYIVSRLNRFFRNNLPSAMFLWVWEYQRRGALHLNYAIEIPPEYRRKLRKEKLQAEWRETLRLVGKKASIDAFEDLLGECEFEFSNDVFIRLWDNRPSKYLAKKESKQPRTRADGTIGGVSRWYDGSRHLRKLVKEYSFDYVIVSEREQDDTQRKSEILKQIPASSGSLRTVENRHTGKIVGVSFLTYHHSVREACLQDQFRQQNGNVLEPQSNLQEIADKMGRPIPITEPELAVMVLDAVKPSQERMRRKLSSDAETYLYDKLFELQHSNKPNPALPESPEI